MECRAEAELVRLRGESRKIAGVAQRRGFPRSCAYAGSRRDSESPMATGRNRVRTMAQRSERSLRAIALASRFADVRRNEHRRKNESRTGRPWAGPIEARGDPRRNSVVPR